MVVGTSYLKLLVKKVTEQGAQVTFFLSRGVATGGIWVYGIYLPSNQAK